MQLARPISPRLVPAVVASTAALVLGAPAGPAAAVARTGTVDGRIAYVSHDQIRTVTPDGTRTTVLTSAGRNVAPTWSPDGRTIAYVHVGNDGDSDLWTMRADGSEKVAVTGTGQVSTGGASWSPDGESLAFGGPCVGIAEICTDYFATHFALDTISAGARGGSPVTALTSDGTPAEVLDRVSWSSTGAEIAYSSSGFGFYPGDEFMLVYRLADGSGDIIEMLGAGGVYGNLANPAFSPDGLEVGYDAYVYGQPEILHEGISVCAYPTGQCDFRDVLHDSQLAFAPSQQRVVIVRDLARDRLVIARADGTHRVKLASGSQPSWQHR